VYVNLHGTSNKTIENFSVLDYGSPDGIYEQLATSLDTRMRQAADPIDAVLGNATSTET
jgi:hypothetical protein